MIKGNGQSGNQDGRPKNDQTGTVRSFIKDSSYIYAQVLKHVRSCADAEPCDPVQILGLYLKNRDTPKKRNMTSKGLHELSLKYAKAFPNRIPRSLGSEFLWRSGDIELMTSSTILEPEELLWGLKMTFDNRKHDHSTGKSWQSKKKYSALLDIIGDGFYRGRAHMYYQGYLVIAAARVYDMGGDVSPENTELLNLAVVGEILEE